MILHVALRMEALPTLERARERPLIRVDPHVNFQVLTLTEGAMALGKSATEGMSAVVHVHVRFQSDLPLKNFFASFKGADQDLDVACDFL